MRVHDGPTEWRACDSGKKETRQDLTRLVYRHVDLKLAGRDGVDAIQYLPRSKGIYVDEVAQAVQGSIRYMSQMLDVGSVEARPKYRGTSQGHPRNMMACARGDKHKITRQTGKVGTVGRY